MRVNLSDQVPAPSEIPAGDEPTGIERYAPDSVPVGERVRTSHHFARMAGSRRGVLLFAFALPLGLISGGLMAGAPGAIGGALAAFLAWGITHMVSAHADARAEFFRAYAEQRGLLWQTRGPVHAATPLLRRGVKRYVSDCFEGELPGGMPGRMAHYTYETVSMDSSGVPETEKHRFTIVTASIPALVHRVPALYVQRRRGFRFLDGAEDVFRRMKRIRLESEALDRRCEIFADPRADDIWMRRLFSPSFVHFLGDEAHDAFAFEVESGTLCCNVKGHITNAAELDEICLNAGTVANRLIEEVLEGIPPESAISGVNGAAGG